MDVKQRTKLLGNKKAVSPVIATVILVATTIVVAVAVAYWMGSIASLYTRFESLEITATTMDKTTFDALDPGLPDAAWVGKQGWIITLDVKNSGTDDATITLISINNQPLSKYDRTALDATITLPLTVKKGRTKQVILYIVQDETGAEEGFTAGTNIQVALHANMDYPKLMTLT